MSEDDSADQLAQQVAALEVEVEPDYEALAFEAHQRNCKSLLYRQPREIILRVLALLALESGRSFARAARSAQVFRVGERDALFWEALCRAHYPDWQDSSHKYRSWYHMFSTRPQIRYNGVYVCTSRYMRRAEQETRSWLQPLVEVVYYRYIRLYEDGTCLTHVTPREPERVLPFEIDHPEASRGQWRVDRDHNVLAIRVKINKTNYNSHLEFKVRSFENKLHNMLEWRLFKVMGPSGEWDSLPHQKEGAFSFRKTLPIDRK